MYNKYYRNGNYDMRKCNCPYCRENRNDWDNDDENYERQECCFPIDIHFSVKEGKKDFNNFDYQEEDTNDYGYAQQNNYGYGDRNTCSYQNQKPFEKEDNQKKCQKECCFPFDVCFSIKEGKRKDNRYDDCKDNKKEDCREGWDRKERCEKHDKNDRCEWQNNNCRRPCQNRSNCCLGILAGCLFGRKF